MNDPAFTNPDQKDPFNEEIKSWKDFINLSIQLLKKLRLYLIFNFRKVFPRTKLERRGEVQVQLRDASEPDFDYFVLVLLSCSIATMGLLTNSPATIIGAMLVAPLMSPILGLGLASIRGDATLLKNAGSALLRGAALAILLSYLITVANDWLPFVALQDLPAEVLVRTRPSPIDLGIALAGGLAATFALIQPELSAALPGVAIATALMPPLCVVGVGLAMGDWRVAGGAFLLFITNAVTIAASSIFLFFISGFSPPKIGKEGRIPQSLMISIGLTVLLMAPLGWQSYQFVQDANLRRTINQVVERRVTEFGADLDMLSWEEVDDIHHIDITVLVNQSSSLHHADSQSLQNLIAADLQEPVKLTINQVIVDELDPSIPPSPTPTATLGPSPTPTWTPTPTNTFTPSPSPTVTFTSTSTPTPTHTPTLTPTQGLAIVTIANGANLRASVDGPAITFLPQGSQVTVLYGREITNGWVWIEVMDSQGRIGWIPQFYTTLIEFTETPTLEALP